MPNAGVPEFHLRIWYAKIHDKSCPTVAIQTGISNADRLISIMQSIEPVNLATFYTWDDWHNSLHDQRVKIINKQNKFLKDFKSLSLDGFTDDNNIRMGNNAFDSTTIKFSTMNLNDFIIKKFLVRPDKCSLIAKVTKPILGWREFLVKKKLEIKQKLCSNYSRLKLYNLCRLNQLNLY